jgi:hypothetical protein
MARDTITTRHNMAQNNPPPDPLTQPNFDALAVEILTRLINIENFIQEISNRGPRKKPTIDAEAGSQANRTAWAEDWLNGDSPATAIEREWRARWDLTGGYHRRPPEPADDPRFGEDPLEKHIGLLKHESSVLIQIRTGKIGPQCLSISQEGTRGPTGVPLRSCFPASGWVGGI